MKISIPLLLSFLCSPCIYADCVLPGLVSFAHQNGLAPECGLTGSQGFIALHGDARFSWSRLRVGPAEAMTSLKITGNHTAVHVVRGPVVIAGAMSADGPLAIFASQVTTEATGSITAPELVVSALLPATDSAVDGYFTQGTSVELQVTTTEEALAAGLVTNRGHLTATQRSLTVLGGEILNGGTLRSAKATTKIVAAEKVSHSRTLTTARYAAPQLGNTIYNGGTIVGVRVEMRALPQACTDEDCTFLLDTPIINQGKIKGTDAIRGVVFDVSGATEDSLHAKARVENRRDADPAMTGFIITPDVLPLFKNDPTYVVGGKLKTTLAQLRPNDGDNPAVPPSRQPQTQPTAAVPLLASTSAAGVVLRATPNKTNQPTASTGTRGATTSSSASPEEEKAKRKKPAKPVIVRGAFFGVAVKN